MAIIRVAGHEWEVDGWRQGSHHRAKLKAVVEAWIERYGLGPQGGAVHDLIGAAVIASRDQQPDGAMYRRVATVLDQLEGAVLRGEPIEGVDDALVEAAHAWWGEVVAA